MEAALSVVVIVTLASILVTWRLASRATQRLRHFERHANRFFTHAQPLVDDEETPPQVLDMLSFLNAQMGDRRAAFRLLRVILRRPRMTMRDPRRDPAFHEMSAFFGRHNALHEHFALACIAAIHAMTFRTSVVGPILRRLSFFDIDVDAPRAERLAAAMATVAKKPSTILEAA